MAIIEVGTGQDNAWVDITSQVQRVVAASGVRSGIAVVCSLHTTGGRDDQRECRPGRDGGLIRGAGTDGPNRGPICTARATPHAHVKATLMGLSVTVPIENGHSCWGRGRESTSANSTDREGAGGGAGHREVTAPQSRGRRVSPMTVETLSPAGGRSCYFSASLCVSAPLRHVPYAQREYPHDRHTTHPSDNSSIVPHSGHSGL